MNSILRLRRLRYRIAKFRSFGSELHRRAAVEAELFDMASGKKPLPMIAGALRSSSACRMSTGSEHEWRQVCQSATTSY